MSAILEANEGQQKTKYVLCTFIGCPNTDDAITDHELYQALRYEGLESFDDILIQPSSFIDKLSIDGPDPADPRPPLSANGKALLRIAIALYHEVSRIKGKPIDIRLVPKTTFDSFRSTGYKPDSTVTPWFEPEE